MPAGDRFVEYFYNDRWYNIFAVHEGDSHELKGWYCNVCRPAILGEVDHSLRGPGPGYMGGSPDGRPLVLDEDEFAALAITAEERATGLKALERTAAFGGKRRLAALSLPSACRASMN